MKTILALFLLALFSGQAQTNLPPENRPNPHVLFVLKHQFMARTNCVIITQQYLKGKGYAGYYKKAVLNRKAYAEAIQRIDFSKCPKEFQLAWIDYCQAWSDIASSNDAGILLVELGAAAATGNVAAIAAVGHGATQFAQSQAAKKEAADHAWFQLQRAAVKFNCPPPRKHIDWEEKPIAAQ